MRPTRRIMAVLGVCALMLAALVAASAQERPQMQSSASQFTPQLERCANLMGAEVKNNKGETLGTIEEFVFTRHPSGSKSMMKEGKMKEGMKGTKEYGSGTEKGSGSQGQGQGESGAMKAGASAMGKSQCCQISYVVLSSGGFLGVGDKYFAIPWSSFQIRSHGLQDVGRSQVTVTIEKQKLENAEGFDKDNWPDAADPSLAGLGTQKGSGGMGMQPPREVTGENKGMIEHRRLSKLKGTAVMDSQGEEVGPLEDCIIDTRDGVVAYAVLEGGVKTTDGSTIMAVPWNSLNFHTENDELHCQLDMPKANLQTVAIGEKSFDRLRDLAYARDLYQRFDEQPYWETFGYHQGSEGARESGSETEKKPEGGR